MGTDDPLRLTVGFLLCGFTISDNEGLLLLYMLDRKRRRLRKRRKSSRTSWLPHRVTAISFMLCIFVWSWPKSDLATLQAEKHRKEAERRGPCGTASDSRFGTPLETQESSPRGRTWWTKIFRLLLLCLSILKLVPQRGANKGSGALDLNQGIQGIQGHVSWTCQPRQRWQEWDGCRCWRWGSHSRDLHLIHYDSSHDFGIASDFVELQLYQSAARKSQVGCGLWRSFCTSTWSRYPICWHQPEYPRGFHESSAVADSNFDGFPWAMLGRWLGV